MSILRANHYPPLSALPSAGEERAAAHTDATAITILKVDDAPGGLQVQLPSGTWVDVPKVEDSFVVNIGDILMRWTNDRYISTMHRVINPPPEFAATADRMSIPYFCIPDYDAVVECIPSCKGLGAKYAKATAGELLSARYTATYSLDTKEAQRPSYQPPT
jgi:isopenicillin N synthase-like dioxygenase